ncbi:hypothetical protein [Thalassomonas actiniarum]|uniref:Uncharacterized protein n=1 Tax=Thalassomonas actiniarum TaxID=485447 RepID=A0AAE9YYG5_9GAMM|nr:hypothetical protein [Thalassomonas actiniarum]WDE02679.1 hypothetical protein SG35_030225 [Thalassomonas actiniarum]
MQKHINNGEGHQASPFPGENWKNTGCAAEQGAIKKEEELRASAALC